MIIGTILQQPQEVLDYDVDYTGFFSSTDSLLNDSIADTGSTAVITPDENVAIEVVKSSDTVLKLIISSVKADTEFKVTIKMVTNNGRVKEDELILVGIDF